MKRSSVRKKSASHRKSPSRQKPILRKKTKGIGQKKRAEHYLRVTFGRFWNGTTEIAFFIHNQLHDVLKALKEKEVGLEIYRLEPLDHSYTHVNMSEFEIRKRMVQFALHHGLHRSHNRLVARFPLKKLESILRDYDVMFDLFFTDMSFHTKKIKIELMDPFFGSLLVKGDIKTLSQFEKLVKKNAFLPVKFELVDHP